MITSINEMQEFELFKKFKQLEKKNVRSKRSNIKRKRLNEGIDIALEDTNVCSFVGINSLGEEWTVYVTSYDSTLMFQKVLSHEEELNEEAPSYTQLSFGEFVNVIKTF